MDYIQNFNYHTHTERCGHAEKGYEDEGYVREALKTGIQFLAFTDHIPFSQTNDTKTNVRMPYEKIDEYVQSIIDLKNKYKGLIKIETGFEFEYLPQELDHIFKMKKLVDKMILGQHFVLDSKGEIKYFSSKELLTDKEMIQYVCLIVKALDAGLPDIIAHPDLFLKYRQEFGEKEEIVTRKLCELVEKYQVSMEINLNEIYREYVRANRTMPTASEQEKIQFAKSRIKYPNPQFWSILSEYNIKVLFGIDAHSSNQILNSDISHRIAKEILGEILKRLNFVDSELRVKPRTTNSNEAEIEI